MLKVYHNNRCSKSRCALELLQQENIGYEVVEYLKQTPDKAELKELLVKLNMRPEELVRKNEGIFKEQFAGKKFTDEEWIDLMVAHPVLIERPIIVNGNKAVIGRPAEKIREIL